ncbi:MAG: hypothetical protein J2P23_00580, partial [Microlunatus sp.]|nr:hypothetical protein [Microlunatus sp.]
MILLPADTHIGASYDGESQTMSLPLRILEPGRWAGLAFVLGHELQHALNMPVMDEREKRFLETTGDIAQTTHDYSPAIRDYIADQRTNEASAHLAGWNAVAELIRTADPNATIDKIVRKTPWAADFVRPNNTSGLADLRPGLTVRPDLSFDLSPSNIEAMARYYFDKKPEQTAIGDIGTSDYRNDYGAWAVMQAAAFHRYFTRDVEPPPPMIINLTQLGLSRQIMEENGIDLEGVPAQPYL